MNYKELKIVKFAIEQNNLELLKFALSKDKLNKKQLSECLLLAKDKPEFYQELANHISDDIPQTEDETQTETETESKTETEKETEAEAETECKGQLLYYYIVNNVNTNYEKEIPEDLWTKENLEYENCLSHSNGTIIHFLAKKKSEVALKYLKKAINLYPEGCLRKAKDDTGTTPLVNTIYNNNFMAFQMVSYVARTNKIEMNNFEFGILGYIMNNMNIDDVNKYFHHLIFLQKLNIHEKDIEQLGMIMHKVLFIHLYDIHTENIIHRLLEINGASGKLLDYRWKMRYHSTIDTKLKSFNYIFSLKEESEKNVCVLLKSNKFFLYLNKEKDLIIKSPLLLERYLKYCPQNIINEVRYENNSLKNIDYYYSKYYSSNPYSKYYSSNPCRFNYQPSTNIFCESNGYGMYKNLKY